ncbi:MAG TPA: DUF2239 family protein [Gammaproteobacteria bacterium]|nr:DUF2239 family protein [Gammaproteobacteria bacterium]
MSQRNQQQCTAFEGFRCVASGGLTDVVLKTKSVIDRNDRAPVLIFDDVTSELIEVDFRGTADDVLHRLAEAANNSSTSGSDRANHQPPRGRGRPKLGVVGREVTLLPRHWDWLNAQPGGASVALRKLVEQARRSNGGRDDKRRAQEAAYRFMSHIAGNLRDFEEATRALFAADGEFFNEKISSWPEDIRDHASKLAAAAFQKG